MSTANARGRRDHGSLAYWRGCGRLRCERRVEVHTLVMYEPLLASFRVVAEAVVDVLLLRGGLWARRYALTTHGAVRSSACGTVGSA